MKTPCHETAISIAPNGSKAKAGMPAPETLFFDCVTRLNLLVKITYDRKHTMDKLRTEIVKGWDSHGHPAREGYGIYRLSSPPDVDESERSLAASYGPPTPGQKPHKAMLPSSPLDSLAHANGSGFNKKAFAAYLDAQVFKQSAGKCATHVRNALQAAGVDTFHHPADAKNYGPYLLGWGFHAIAPGSTPQAGDIAVIQPTAQGEKDNIS